MAHITDNRHFTRYRDALADAGITMRMWNTLSGPVYGFNLIGTHPGSAKTCLIMDYGKDNGIAVYFETRTNSIAEDIAELTGLKRAE